MNHCLREDWFLLPYELRLQRAHACALQAAGVLSGEQQTGIDQALDRIAEQYTDVACPESDAEDLHTWMEGKLIELAGEAGRRIHTARSRNDQIATLLKMYVVAAGEDLSRRLCALIHTSGRRAMDWSVFVFPLQTHNQFAAPGSVGFWSLRYATAFARVCRHLDYCTSQWRRFCPLGAGAVAGSSIPIDRRIQATELGFDGPSQNALDSTSTRDECLELLWLAAQTALHLQSFATDVIGFAQTQLGWVNYPGAFGTGSSMMPNKTNPDAMELLRGECNAILSAPHEATLLLKGLPSGYNRDLQCIKPLLHRTVEKLHALLTMTTEFLEQLEFDPQRLSASLKLGAIDATLRMEQKVLAGAALRDAHHEIAAELQDAGAPSASNNGVSADSYQTTGSASPAETRRMAEELLAGLPQQS